MQPPGAAERWVPFFDITIGCVRVNATDPIPVELGIPDHAVDR